MNLGIFSKCFISYWLKISNLIKQLFQWKNIWRKWLNGIEFCFVNKTFEGYKTHWTFKILILRLLENKLLNLIIFGVIRRKRLKFLFFRKIKIFTSINKFMSGKAFLNKITFNFKHRFTILSGRLKMGISDSFLHS